MALAASFAAVQPAAVPAAALARSTVVDEAATGVSLGSPIRARAAGDRGGVLALPSPRDLLLLTASGGGSGRALRAAVRASLRSAPWPPSPSPFRWSTVANKGDFIPTDTCAPPEPSAACRTFNSFNEPSVNARGLVVFRARSRGGPVLAQNVHGVYTRDMATQGPVVKILDRNTTVPEPNNMGSVFIEPPSFPRIDLVSSTIATRGNHQPTWSRSSGPGGIAEQYGTTGIYTNPFGQLVTGASKLGLIPDFWFFEVPEMPGTPFDVFPGSPAVTGNTIVFKGNYTVNAAGETGAYYRRITNESSTGPDATPAGTPIPPGGSNPVVLIASTTRTRIPGGSTPRLFGSVAPPSAANGRAVFAGFDDEQRPTAGGIYLAPLTPYPLDRQPSLMALVQIGSQVPGEGYKVTFNRLGEGVSFDGRFVGFWGAWGTETRTLHLLCPTEGNADRIAFCNRLCTEDIRNCIRTVPLHQGIFVHDTKTGSTVAVAKAPESFDDFVFWKFAGRVPGSAEGDDGELASWRSSTFVAVSGLVDGNLTDATFHAAFKARTGEVIAGEYVDPLDGIYLRKGPLLSPIQTLVLKGMNGALLDPEAVDDLGNGLEVTEMGFERDGFRGNSLVVNVRMGSEDDGWAGIYLTHVRDR